MAWREFKPDSCTKPALHGAAVVSTHAMVLGSNWPKLTFGMSVNGCLSLYFSPGMSWWGCLMTLTKVITVFSVGSDNSVYVPSTFIWLITQTAVKELQGEVSWHWTEAILLQNGQSLQRQVHQHHVCQQNHILLWFCERAHHTQKAQIRGYLQLS